MSAQITILSLPQAGPITGTESVAVVQDGVTVQTTTGNISATPSQTQTFLTVNQEPTLPNSRYVGVGNGLTITDNGAQSLYNISPSGALASLVTSSTGIQVKTNSNTLAARSIASSGAGVAVSNGTGVSGNPTVSLTGQVSGLANLSGNGLVTVNTSGVVGSTYIQGTSDEVTVDNGDAVSGYPTVGLADNAILPGTAAVKVPSGDTSQRPAGSQGEFRFNTETQKFEGFSNAAWRQVVTNTGGVVSVPEGGTGFSSYSVGDMVYASSPTAFSKLALGTQGYVIIAGPTGPVWSGISGGTF